MRRPGKGFYFQNIVLLLVTKDHEHDLAHLLLWAAEARKRKDCLRGFCKSLAMKTSRRDFLPTIRLEKIKVCQLLAAKGQEKGSGRVDGQGH